MYDRAKFAEIRVFKGRQRPSPGHEIMCRNVTRLGLKGGRGVKDVAVPVKLVRVIGLFATLFWTSCCCMIIVDYHCYKPVNM